MSDDLPLPEDDAIAAAHPLRSGRHDLYAEAMRLVGARHTKAGLVELVTWLLVERDEVRKQGIGEGLEEPTLSYEEKKRTLPVGSRVEVLRDNGDVMKTTTRSEPWQLGRRWVVMVVGISGGYDLDRVTPVTIDGTPL